MGPASVVNYLCYRRSGGNKFSCVSNQRTHMKRSYTLRSQGAKVMNLTTAEGVGYFCNVLASSNAS